MKLQKRFRRKLREAIEASQISQGELARRMGVTRQMVSLYLCTDRVPGLDVVEKFANALGLADPGVLIDQSEITQLVD